jgi:hypothetical protein
MANQGGDLAKHTVTEDRVCKACARTIATTSADGDLVPVGTQERACHMCTPFEELFEDVKTKDEAFGRLQDRRSEHGGRQKALEEARAAHKTFDNFLIKIEAQPTHNNLIVRDHNQSQYESPNSIIPCQQGQKRNLTSSTPPKSKRRRLNGDTRRVSFDTSVVFRDDTDGRPYQVFNRGSEEYVPGRNAPPEPSGYLNTSGYGVAPSKFFGVKKHKKGWIETKEGREMDEEWMDVVMEEKEGGAEIDGIVGRIEASSKVEILSGHVRRDSLTVNHADGKEKILNLNLSDIATVVNDRAAEEEPYRSMFEAEAAETVQSHPPKPTIGHSEYETPEMVAHLKKHISGLSHADESEQDWTYGFGWKKKLSPSSRPKGEQWKPGLDPQSLPERLIIEMFGRGRTYPMNLRKRDDLG